VAWAQLLGAAAAAGGLLILLLGLQHTFRRAPRLQPAAAEANLPDAQLSVVVPAYNEAINIGPCLSSVLASAAPCRSWQVLVVDDGSSDATAAIAQRQIQASNGAAVPHEQPHEQPRATVLEAGPRPAGEHWVGKNWACSRAVDWITASSNPEQSPAKQSGAEAAASSTEAMPTEASPQDWLLFLDADVRLRPDTLRRALQRAIDDEADLLSLAPRLECGCLAEWMVQPIMASLLGLGFPIEAANDPNTTTAFAAGPFMLFRRSAYDAIGGHRALAAEVVEDLALARRIKGSGYRLRWLLGLDAVDLRMYPNLAALWEGWSKNWCLGLGRRVDRALGAAAVVVLMFSGPWLLAPAAVISLLLPQLASQQPLLQGALALALVGITLQLGLRLWSRSQFQLPLRHWWLMGIGGLLVGALGPTSVWRTLSGRGWTWKGRPLA
jgi:glycosyltransferase involved in cell wall biosynthesis